MRTMTLAVVATLMSAGAAFAADPLEGYWRTAKDDNGHSGLIHVKPCGAQLCGTLVKAYNGRGQKSKAKTWVETSFRRPFPRAMAATPARSTARTVARPIIPGFR